MRASVSLAIHAVVVDAKSHSAAAFYARYGFQAFDSEQRRLFLPLETFGRLGP
jgi:hypothetical protein